MATIRKNARKKIEAILKAAVLIREYKYDDMGDTTGTVTPARVIECGFSDPQMDFERVTQDRGVTRLVIHRNWSFTAYATKEDARRELTAEAFAKYFPEETEPAPASASHTPGPWTTWIERDDSGCITQAGIDTADRSVNIAVCCENLETDDPQNERQLTADLNLIAAAPDMLTALRSIAQIMLATYGRNEDGSIDQDNMGEASAADIVEMLTWAEGEVFSAIAKAEGAAVTVDR